jgi:tetratricopeptide (TPR) repeat protein
MAPPDRIPLPYLLGGMWQTSFTGTLFLSEGDIERSIILSAGQPVQVHSQLQDETLGRMLLEQERITEQQYDTMLTQMSHTGKPAGELLVAMNLMSAQEVLVALDSQVRLKLNNCFRFHDFHYRLERHPVDLDVNAVWLNPIEVIIEGIRNSYNEERLRIEFPVADDTQLAGAPASQVRMARMSKALREFFTRLERGVVLAQLLVSAEDHFQIYCTLYGLHALDLIIASGIGRPDLSHVGLSIPPDLSEEPVEPVGESQDEPGIEDQALEFDIDVTRSVEVPQPEPPAPILDPKLAEKVLAASRQDFFSLLEIEPQTSGEDLVSAHCRLVDDYNLDHIEQSYDTPREKELARRLLEKATAAYKTLADDEARLQYLQELQQDVETANADIPPRIIAELEAQIGKRCICANEYDNAIRHFETAIDLYPNEPSYYCYIGQVRYCRILEEADTSQAIHEDARIPFRRALQIDPNYDEPWVFMGFISKHNQENERAHAEFSRALAINPNNHTARSELAAIEGILGYDYPDQD